jgi:hypothetical protein
MQEDTITVYAGFSPLDFITTVQLPRSADPYSKETRHEVMNQVSVELVYRGLFAMRKDRVLMRSTFQELGEPSTTIEQAEKKGTSFFYAYQFVDSQGRTAAPGERLLSETYIRPSIKTQRSLQHNRLTCMRRRAVVRVL